MFVFKTVSLLGKAKKKSLAILPNNMFLSTFFINYWLPSDLEGYSPLKVFSEVLS